MSQEVADKSSAAVSAIRDSQASLPPDVVALLSTTFDQLRTFSTVCRLGNVRAAARVLGRDHSSVRKQLETLEERFQEVARGRLLVHATSRGGAVQLTEAERRQLNVLEWCDAPFVAIDLLHHRLCHAAVICTRTFARFATARAGARPLRTVPYRCEWDYRFGVLARRADIEAWAPAHPARVTWELLTRLAAGRSRANQHSAIVTARP